jgi:hypothetical protein
MDESAGGSLAHVVPEVFALQFAMETERFGFDLRTMFKEVRKTKQYEFKTRLAFLNCSP